MPPFTKTSARSVAALGELSLLARIRLWLGDTAPRAPFGMGDDCAVLPPSPRPQLVTTDPVIFGRHFDHTAPARQVGAKLLKRNLSDIAAMGGRPRWAVISLALGPDTSTRWLGDFHLGLAAAARRYRVKIVGGDITQASRGFFGAFLTLHGEAAGRRVLTRIGARAGDRIYVTGKLGGSRLGHHLNFTPRLDEAAWLARRSEVRAMLDLSDGLAKDIRALTPAGLAAALCESAIPVSASARQAARRSGLSPLRHALCDGEDYELLFAVRGSGGGKLERAWRLRFPRTRLTRIGHFTRRDQSPPGSLSLEKYHGFEHLR
jgi:thiamine-monophosphate kinase